MVFVADDARNLAVRVPDPVGLVLLANTFSGVPDKTALACAVSGVLASGGRFAVVSWYPLPREQNRVLGEPREPTTEMRLSPEQTVASVEPAGFALEGQVDLPPYQYVAAFA